ncbi:Williams-Beuren syndrome chromosomal region 27 protein [Plakobranchus ocellatus]|uniref:Williams-Beuren syndrome chromosomal region 27 protein n=1 Tax=Plakobranchus ocellatus TaxID=259542 RepID=A0AAV4CFE8_9GAST|nr:Williams-Beuren syndrome chromosomal region 27 protein [Plakobranchus ocellatus]
MSDSDKTSFAIPSKVNDVLFTGDISYEESQKLYRQWAEAGTYDQMLHRNPKEYNALIQFTAGMKDLFPEDKSGRVLDLGAGTGLSGEELLSVGYTNIDALEPCEKFVEIIKAKGIYKNIIERPIEGENSLDIPNDTYDAVGAVGSFCPGHVPSSAILEIVRIVKPGGKFLICMRECFLESVSEYKDRLVPLFEDLEKQGRIQRLEWTRYPNHFAGKDGIRMEDEEEEEDKDRRRKSSNCRMSISGRGGGGQEKEKEVRRWRRKRTEEEEEDWSRKRRTGVGRQEEEEENRRRRIGGRGGG